MARRSASADDRADSAEEKVRPMWLRRAASLGLLTLASYLLLLAFPEPLFAYSVRGRSLDLMSERPLPPQSRGVLWRTEAKLARSPLYDTSQRYRVFVCAQGFRWWLLSAGDSRSAAVARMPFFDNVLVRGAHVERDRYLQATGNEAPGERTLDYLLAHEVTHLMTNRHLGLVRGWRLPTWVREGYADYIGRGASFDFRDACRQFVARPRGAQSGAYLRYTLMVAELLEHDGWTVDRLLDAPPPASEVLERIRCSPAKSR